jgi:thiamine biosynthesis lipoprotein
VNVVVLPARDETFRALGTHVRLIGAPPAARRAILGYHERLSRFLPASELSALNADPRPVVPASPLLRAAVRAGLWAAERSGGLVDPCLLGALEAAGYATSFTPGDPVPPPAGPPRPAAPDPARRWRAIQVDEAAGTIARPPGLRLDLGGSGKGHVADLVAERFAPPVVDCGGDIRVTGAREIEIAHPLRPEPAARVHLRDGAVATSSVVARAWRRADGRPAHHLLDPSTGEPVWTGLLTATALAPTALEAETLAKLALLRGTGDVLTHGGVLVDARGDVEVIS